MRKLIPFAAAAALTVMAVVTWATATPPSIKPKRRLR
jgi:hypothetical protein